VKSAQESKNAVFKISCLLRVARAYHSRSCALGDYKDFNIYTAAFLLFCVLVKNADYTRARCVLASSFLCELAVVQVKGRNAQQ
jgi:hypothetical protein